LEASKLLQGRLIIALLCAEEFGLEMYQLCSNVFPHAKITYTLEVDAAT